MRGQGIIFDFVVSLSFFVVGVVIMVGALDMLGERMEKERDYANVARAAYFASESLLSLGSPENWNTNVLALNQIQVGLGAAPGELHGAKIRNFAALNATDYDGLRSALGVGKYDLYVNITQLQGNQSYLVGKFFDESYGDFDYRVERYALLDGNLTRVVVGVWK
jgi:hypothetical protein